MRGITPICNDTILDVMPSYDGCEEFYRNIFESYGLTYDTETIRQKRAFVAAITEHFILKRCHHIKYKGNNGKYGCEEKDKKEIIDVMDTYRQLQKQYESEYNMLVKIAQYFNEEVKDFSKEINMNRDDKLSNFAKGIERLYYYKNKK